MPQMSFQLLVLSRGPVGGEASFLNILERKRADCLTCLLLFRWHSFTSESKLNSAGSSLSRSQNTCASRGTSRSYQLLWVNLWKTGLRNSVRHIDEDAKRSLITW